MTENIERPPELQEKPKEGWNVKPAVRVIDTSIGVQKKINPWAPATEVLQIPDLEGDDATENKQAQPTMLIAPDIESITQLNKVLSQKVDPNHDGIDISLLTSVIKEQSEITERDIGWSYESLQTDIAKAFREIYKEYYES